MSSAIACPACEGTATDVKDSRSTPMGVRRRRSCRGCGHRFTTFETVGKPRKCNMCGKLKVPL